MLPSAWSVALAKFAFTPEGAVPSVGVQLVAKPARTTTMRFAPLPFAQLIPIWSKPTSENNRAEACVVGSAAAIVCAPPAVVEPVSVTAAEYVRSPVATALTEIVLPGVAPAATSAVMKT